MYCIGYYYGFGGHVNTWPAETHGCLQMLTKAATYQKVISSILYEYQRMSQDNNETRFTTACSKVLLRQTFLQYKYPSHRLILGTLRIFLKSVILPLYWPGFRY